MIVIVLPILIVFFLSAVIFHLAFVRSGKLTFSERQWEAVDYLWYGFGFLSLLIGGFQVLGAVERSHLDEKLKVIEKMYFQVEKITSNTSNAVSSKDADECQLLADITTAIRETQFTTDWPIGNIRFHGRSFDSLNWFISERAKELDVKKTNWLVVVISTGILDSTGEARALQRRLLHLRPPLLITVIMPYFLAVIIALRITKVTFKVRRASIGIVTILTNKTNSGDAKSFANEAQGLNHNGSNT